VGRFNKFPSLDFEHDEKQRANQSPKNAKKQLDTTDYAKTKKGMDVANEIRNQKAIDEEIGL
jgi:hypothetical protein